MEASTTSISTTNLIGTVIVTYHTPPDQLQRCLASLHQNNINDIAIIDNSEQNIGFAAGANQGAAKITKPYLLFINPDAYLTPNTIYPTLRLLQTRPNIGILGLMLCQSNLQPETSCFGRPVNPFSIFTRHFAPPVIPREPSPVGWVSGGAMIISSQAWQKLSGFDSRFFLYWEDVDICRRAWQAGYQVYLAPSAKVIHERGSSLKDITQKTRYYDESADNYFRKHYPKPICLWQRYSRHLYRLFFRLAR